MITELGLEAVMADGTVLRSDVYRPRRRAPAILTRTPYGREFGPSMTAAIDPDRAVAAGYALVVQDVRGRHGSDGDFTNLNREAQDGLATVEWLAAQDWCDGRVAMAGRSYCAMTQWTAAGEAPAALRAIAPVVTGCDVWDGWVYQSGAFQLGFNLFWAALMIGGRPPRTSKLYEAYRHLPLGEAPPLVADDDIAVLYRRWLAHDRDSSTWRDQSLRGRHGAIEVPALVVSGWYDLFLGGALENYRRVRTEAAPRARAGTRLIIGPWGHGTAFGTWPAEALAGGAAAMVDTDGEQLAFFAEHVLGEQPAQPTARARVFLTGADRWCELDDWPAPGAREARLHLAGSQGRDGDGRLVADAVAVAGSDELPYDPHDPAPTLGGPISLPGPMLRPLSGPVDQSSLLERGDVLVYWSAPLEQPLAAVGPLHAVLHAASTGSDFDLVAKVCDAEPDGPLRILSEGVMRARYGVDAGAPQAVEPGRVARYVVDLVAIGHVFAPRHRVCLLVTGASFPRFDRNPSMPIPPGEVREADLAAATHTVHHGAEHPSALVLTILDGVA